MKHYSSQEVCAFLLHFLFHKSSRIKLQVKKKKKVSDFHTSVIIIYNDLARYLRCSALDLAQLQDYLALDLALGSWALKSPWWLGSRDQGARTFTTRWFSPRWHSSRLFSSRLSFRPRTKPFSQRLRSIPFSSALLGSRLFTDRLSGARLGSGLFGSWHFGSALFDSKAFGTRPWGSRPLSSRRVSARLGARWLWLYTGSTLKILPLISLKLYSLVLKNSLDT